MFEGQSLSKDKKLRSRVAVRVFLCLLITIGMLVASVLVIRGTLGTEVLYGWLLVVVLWATGSPTQEEQKAVQRLVAYEEAERRKNNGK